MPMLGPTDAPNQIEGPNVTIRGDENRRRYPALAPSPLAYRSPHKLPADGPTGAPLVKPAGSDPTALSFTNLVELHLLGSLRRKQRTTLPAVRSAIDYLAREYDDDHPLVRRGFVADGVEVLARHFGRPLNFSATAHEGIRKAIASHSERVEYDESEVASRVYPFTRGVGRKGPKLIVIDPAVGFGRPVIAGSGVHTGVIASRVKAGELMADLADDYRLQPAQIEEAVRYELAG